MAYGKLHLSECSPTSTAPTAVAVGKFYIYGVGRECAIGVDVVDKQPQVAVFILAVVAHKHIYVVAALRGDVYREGFAVLYLPAACGYVGIVVVQLALGAGCT